MERLKDLKKISVVKTQGFINPLARDKKDISPIQTNFMDNRKDTIKQGQKRGNKTKKTGVYVASHTEAEVNWTMIANKVTIPNIIKGGLTLSGGYIGSLIGAGLLTGVGFVAGGPGGAVLGYSLGNVAGFGAGVIGGHKFGEAVANEIRDERDEESIVESGVTQINVDTSAKINSEERIDKDEFSRKV